MSRHARLAAATMMVLVACGGGNGAAEDSTTVAAAADASTTTTTTVTTTTTTAAPVDPGAGASDDFCKFAVDYAENVEFSPLGMSPADVESTLRATNDAIQQAARVAPSEIRDDVQLFAEAYGGFIEVLDELDFNFLAFDEDMLEDPRVLALEDPALEEAGDRISAYCGLDDFLVAGPDTDGGTGGSGGGLPEASLPEGFPEDLVPPGGVVVVALDMAGAQSVTFEIESPTDDVIDFYSDVIGEPMVQLDEPKGALWTTDYQGSTLNVVVSEVAPGMVQANIIIE